MFSITFSKGKCSATQRCAKMHLMLCKNIFLHHILLVQKCIWCKNAFDATFCCAKMHFCKTKCYKCIFAYIFLCKMFSVHFPKENVQQNKMLQMHLMLCKNAFCASNAFDAKMHLIPKCILAVQKCILHHIFQRKMFSVHFPLENVQRTFYEVKCSACTFCNT